MAYNFRQTLTPVAFGAVIGLGLTCQGGNTPPQESATFPDSTGEVPPDTASFFKDQDLEGKDLTSEERELLKYCKKVQEISDKQQETDRKLEEILAHVESLKNPPQSVTLDEDKKEQLKREWMEIEDQKITAIKELSKNSAAAR